jgi:hypothetical protein
MIDPRGQLHRIDVSSMSMLPFTFRRPWLSVYSFAGFVRMVKPL